MIWIAICFLLSVAVFVSGWKEVTKIKENGHTERLKIDIEGDQVEKYNEWLADTNEHMLSDKIATKFKIIIKDGDQ